VRLSLGEALSLFIKWALSLFYSMFRVENRKPEGPSLEGMVLVEMPVKELIYRTCH